MAQVRVTFTGDEVGDGNPNDSHTLPNQDGGLAVRFQAENVNGDPAGFIARFGDEGLYLAAGTPGDTFDIRDLVTGTSRGSLFRTVILGTQGVDNSTGTAESDYINLGLGNDGRGRRVSWPWLRVDRQRNQNRRGNQNLQCSAPHRVPPEHWSLSALCASLTRQCS